MFAYRLCVSWPVDHYTLAGWRSSRLVAQWPHYYYNPNTTKKEGTKEIKTKQNKKENSRGDRKRWRFWWSFVLLFLAKVFIWENGRGIAAIIHDFPLEASRRNDRPFTTQKERDRPSSYILSPRYYFFHPFRRNVCSFYTLFSIRVSTVHSSPSSVVLFFCRCCPSHY